MVRLGQPNGHKKVMRLLRRDGALTIRDIEDDVLTERSICGRAASLQSGRCNCLLYREVTISERTGMLKTYELMTRISAGIGREAGAIG